MDAPDVCRRVRQERRQGGYVRARRARIQNYKLQIQHIRSTTRERENVGMVYSYIRMAVIAASLLIIACHLQVETARAQNLDELYQRAKKEGRVVLYAPLSSKTEEIVFPAFRKRFPDIIIEHVDATSDKLVARAITEARGGKVFGDVFGGTKVYLQQLKEQNLLPDINLPEAAAYPAGMKGGYWVASDTEYFVAGWNTSRLKK